MKEMLYGPHRRGEDGHRGAETGSPTLNTPNTANRAFRAINADGSGAGPALTAGADRRETTAAGIRQRGMTPTGLLCRPRQADDRDHAARRDPSAGSLVPALTKLSTTRECPVGSPRDDHGVCRGRF